MNLNKGLLKLKAEIKKQKMTGNLGRIMAMAYRDVEDAFPEWPNNTFWYIMLLTTQLMLGGFSKVSAEKGGHLERPTNLPCLLRIQ